MPLVAIGALAAVGLLETVRDGATALVVVFVLIEVIVVSSILWLRRSAPLAIRADLCRWVDTVSATTGESPSRVAERALSAARTGLTDAGPVDERHR